MPGGRKTLREELRIIQRYSELTEPYFRVLKKNLESDKKDDQRWAADNLKGAFAKMIPQDINADLGGNLILTWKSSFHTSLENGNSDSTTLENAGLSLSSIDEQEKLQQSSTTSSEMPRLPQTLDSHS